MAVKPDTVARQWAGSTGAIGRDGGTVEYKAHWHLQTDNALDQAQSIIIWWQLNRFPLGTEYAYANDLIGSLATASNIEAVRKPETTDWWMVIVTYTRESDDAKQTLDDEHTTDPLEYRPVIRCSTNAISKPATKLRYLGGYSLRIGAKIPVGFTVPVSSNLKPFDPLPEVDSFHWWIYVVQNLSTFDGNESRIGFLNGEVFTVNYKGFTRGPIAPGQAKIRDCEVEFTRENTRDFWRVGYYFEVLPDGETFYHSIPDIGMDSLACGPKAGGGKDPDLHGGTFGQDVGDTPVVPGRPRHVAMIDAHGMPIRSPVLLDGDGHALDVCSDSVTPVYGHWWEGKEVTFQNVPVIREIVD